MKQPFSRIISWGKAFQTIQNYMTINNYQSMGYTQRQARFMLDMDLGLIELQAG